MNIEELIKDLKEKKATIEKEQKQINKELSSLAVDYYIVVKEINHIPYYYMQWREDSKVKSKSLGRVLKYDISLLEKKIDRKKKLEKQRDENQLLLKSLEKSLRDLLKDEERISIFSRDEYSFEVFWKEELVSRVRVKGNNVYVTRYSKNPGKQLFFAEKMNRFQLNEVFRLRCWEKERTDINELLDALGLKEYNPAEIVRKTHGVSYNDCIWFRFSGELIDYKEILVR